MGLWISLVPYSLFTFLNGGLFSAVLVYVHNIILAGNNSDARSMFKKYINKCFLLKDHGPLKYFIGIKFTRNSTGLFLL